MKQKIPVQSASRLINCGMVILVSCGYKDKKNITTCAWHMPVSKEPPAVAVALAQGHFSSDLIKKSGEFIINVPTWEKLKNVMACGSLKGAVCDKAKEASLTYEDPVLLRKAAKIKECVASLECSVIDVREVGDHFLFLGEVVCAQAEETLFKNGFWDTNECTFIFHLGGKYFFQSAPFSEYK